MATIANLDNRRAWLVGPSGDNVGAHRDGREGLRTRAERLHQRLEQLDSALADEVLLWAVVRPATTFAS